MKNGNNRKNAADGSPVEPAKSPKQPKLNRTHKPENMSLEEWQRQLRVEYGKSQEFRLENRGDHPVFSEFALTNPVSNRTYRIAITWGRFTALSMPTG